MFRDANSFSRPFAEMMLEMLQIEKSWAASNMIDVQTGDRKARFIDPNQIIAGCA
jgi:hypothetical protein